MKKKLFIAIFIILLISLLSACETDIVRADARVESISVDGMLQLYYFLGDELYYENAKLYVIYEDGTIDDIPLTKDMIDSSFNTQSTGIKQVKVNYKNVSTTFQIEVLDLVIESIEIINPTKTEYIEGTPFDVTGGIFKVKFEGGRVIDVPMMLNNVTQFNSDVTGSQYAKVTYRTETKEILVTVVPKQLVSVSVKTPPTNKSVFVLNTINPAGMIFNFHYNNNRIEEIRVRDLFKLDFDFVNDKVENPTEPTEEDAEENDKKVETYRKKIFIGNATITSSLELVFDKETINNVKRDFNKVTYTKETVIGNETNIESLEFHFFNDIATPSTEVTVAYTETKVNGSETTTKTFETKFRIQVLARRWKSMQITHYPVTRGILTSPAQYDEQGNEVAPEVRTPSTKIQNIVQGDTIDLSSGLVEVTFDDNTIQTYRMSDNLFRVYNIQTTEKSEIQGVTIEPLEKKDVPVGDCYLDYNIKISESLYPYDTDPEIKITAKDKEGNAVAIITSGERKLIEVTNAEIYTITITASVVTSQVIDGINQDVVLVTAKSYKIMAVNAVEPRRILDISSAGDYILSVIYMENTDWSAPMSVRVVSRTPTSMEIDNFGDIDSREYIVGDKVNIAFVKYRMKYDNGDIDPYMPVEARMLSPEVTLSCDYPSTQRTKTISFTLYGITSKSFTVNIVPVRVVYLELDPPTNTYVAQGAIINPAGGTLTAYMNNNTKTVLNLENIVGLGSDKAQIINDPISDDNRIIREITPYSATILYKQKQITFDYYVVERLVESLQLIRSGTEKTTYFENEPINLEGLSLRVRWRNSNNTDIIPVTKSLLYKYDPYKVGPQTLKIRYRGIVNESFSIIVLPRQVIEITILQKPKTIYINGVDYSLDLSGIRISKRYNDGSIEEQIGINLQDSGSGSYGWQSNASSIDFSDLVLTQTVVLSYTDYYNAGEPISISYDIKVKMDQVETFYINPSDDKNPEATQNFMIAVVSRGMDLNMKKWDAEKQSVVDTLIFVKFAESEELVEVPLTANMVNYEKSDITLGTRRVTITYNGVSINAYVTVSDSFLYAVSIETYPKINYMLGEKLDLTGGTIRRTFHSNISEDTRTDFMPMMVEGITISGFDQSLTESDYAPGESYKERVITITYLNLNYSYNIKIYKKFNANISYYSTISFYGDVSLPYAGVNMDVLGFSLPLITTGFINSIDAISELPGSYIELIVTDEEGNIKKISYQVGDVTYLKLRMEDGLIKYIDVNKIMTDQYPSTPAQGGNKYLILVEVEGNRYYNPINYAQREFRIINKFLNVVTVVPNSDAIVWRFDTEDDPETEENNNPRAVYLASKYIEELLPTQSQLNMFLASPSYDGFEIVIIRWGTYDLTILQQNIIAYIQQKYWSYFYDGRIYEKDVPPPPGAYGIVDKTVKVASVEQVIGVNTRTYGEGSDILSYYVPSGGLIAVRDKDNFFTMELFTGNLYRLPGEDVLYNVLNDGIGTLISGYDITDEQIGREGTQVSGYETIIELGESSTLINANYFINFQSQNYRIAPKSIIEVQFLDTRTTTPTTINYNGKDYQVVEKYFDGEIKFVEAKYRDTENGPLHNFNISQMRYYYIDGENEILLTEGYPSSIGMYRVRITNNYNAKEGYEGAIEWECLLIIS